MLLLVRELVKMATVHMMRESPVEETLDRSPRSPEAKLGMKVEDLWDVQEPQLSPTEKLNACFESIPVSAFPSANSSQGVVFAFVELINRSKN